MSDGQYDTLASITYTIRSYRIAPSFRCIISWCKEKGTSISYKALDYRFKNTTKYPIQIRVWLDDTFLYGEIRSTVPLKEKYKIIEEDNHYAKDEDGVFYRNSKVYRIITNKETNQEIKKELILNNHSKVMYDYNLIPKEEIKE